MEFLDSMVQAQQADRCAAHRLHGQQPCMLYNM